MTDEQIIKATECCIRVIPQCSECPYRDAEDDFDCEMHLRKNAIQLLDVAKDQKAEIASLKRTIGENDKEIVKLQKRIIFWHQDMDYRPEEIKSEAIKEFAKRLKSQAYSYSDICGYRSTVVDVVEIDRVLREMAEEQK